MRVGESLESAWQTFKQHTGALVAATFALVLTQLAFHAILMRSTSWILSWALPTLISGLVMGGHMNVARIAARGEEPTLADAFAPFTARQGDYLLVGLAFGAGSVLLLIGALVIGFLFLFAPLLVVDGRDFKTALRESKDLTVGNLGGGVLALFVVLVALNVLGVLTGIGWLASFPITSLMVVRAYESLRTRVLPAGAATATP